MWWAAVRSGRGERRRNKRVNKEERRTTRTSECTHLTGRCSTIYKLITLSELADQLLIIPLSLI